MGDKIFCVLLGCAILIGYDQYEKYEAKQALTNLSAMMQQQQALSTTAAAEDYIKMAHKQGY